MVTIEKLWLDLWWHELFKMLSYNHCEVYYTPLQPAQLFSPDFNNKRCGYDDIFVIRNCVKTKEQKDITMINLCDAFTPTQIWKDLSNFFLDRSVLRCERHHYKTV